MGNWIVHRTTDNARNTPETITNNLLPFCCGADYGWIHDGPGRPNSAWLGELESSSLQSVKGANYDLKKLDARFLRVQLFVLACVH